MGAYLATPPLPWAYNQGGTIILRDKYVTLQDLIDGVVVFQVQDNHGDVSNASVVQYPSDQKYYLQANGSMLWQLGDISQAVNRIQVIPTLNIPQGFSIVGVTVQDIEKRLGAYSLDGDDWGIALAEGNTISFVVINGQIPYGNPIEDSDDCGFYFEPDPFDGENFAFTDNYSPQDFPSIQTVQGNIRISEQNRAYVEVDGLTIGEVPQGESSPMLIRKLV